MESPMVYDQVEFSWRIASDALNVLQRSYRIVVESAAGIVWWDTGEIISSRQSFLSHFHATVIGYLVSYEEATRLRQRFHAEGL